MFLDEARLSLHLQHANIVRVFDIGMADTAYFIVMEFVDGANLKTHHRVAAPPGQAHARVAHTLYLMMEVCKGLQLRARPHRPRDRARARHRPPRHLAAEHPHLEERRGEARRLRPRQGDLAARVDRPGRGEGQVQLPLARGGERQGGRPPRRHLRRRHPPVRAAHRQAPVLRRDRLPDGRAGAAGARCRRSRRRTPRSTPELEQIVRKALARDLERSATRRRATCRTRSRSTCSRSGSRSPAATSSSWCRRASREKQRSAAARPQPVGNLIDTLINEEIVKFTSLDGIAASRERRRARAARPIDGSGNAPLDPGLVRRHARLGRRSATPTRAAAAARATARPTAPRRSGAEDGRRRRRRPRGAARGRRRRVDRPSAQAAPTATRPIADASMPSSGDRELGGGSRRWPTIRRGRRSSARREAATAQVAVVVVVLLLGPRVGGATRDLLLQALELRQHDRADSVRRATGPAPHVLAIVLAGGEGRRLWPLTADRAKPAVPIGGRYRLIDFVLSNLVNSGLLKIKVLTQYKSRLAQHAHRARLAPAGVARLLRRGGAGAAAHRRATGSRARPTRIYQSLNVITDEEPDYVARLRRRPHLQDGRAPDARLPPRRASADADGGGHPGAGRRGARVRHPRGRRPAARCSSFDEKPTRAARDAGPARLGAGVDGQLHLQHRACSSRSWRATPAATSRRTTSAATSCPTMVARGRDVYAYDFSQNEIPGVHERERGYWRDVGTIDAYWQANMDLVQVRADVRPLQPALADPHLDAPAAAGQVRVRRPGDGAATRAWASPPTRWCRRAASSRAGASTARVLSPQVRINSFAHVEESILIDGVDVGRHARVRRAIIDKGVHIPPGAEIGFDPEADARRFTVSDGDRRGARRATSSSERATRRTSLPAAHAPAALRRPATRAGGAAVGAAARRARLPRRGARCSTSTATCALTVNFVPSLVAAARGGGRRARATPGWRWRCSRRASWTPEERAVPASSASSRSTGTRGIEPRPRYRELLEKRGRDAQPSELARARGQFTDGELRDLTVLFHLAWLGFAAREGDAELAALEHKGRDLRRRRISRWCSSGSARPCARVLPLYRKLAERGQVELSSSPYYHPIVPLLIDSEHARRAQPDAAAAASASPGPTTRARRSRAAPTAHARAFGAPPRGHVAARGIGLARGGRRLRARGHRAGSPPTRATCGARSHAAGKPRARGDLYRAYRHDGVDLVFRDREISDRIGFAYAHGDAARRRRRSARRARAPARAVDRAAPASRRWCRLPRRGEPVGGLPGLGRAVPARAVRRAVAATASCAAASIGRAPRRARRRASSCRAALRLVDRLRLPHLDRRPGEEPRLGAARARARRASSARAPSGADAAQLDAALRAPARRRGLRLVLVVRRAVPLGRGRALRSRCSAPTCAGA